MTTERDGAEEVSGPALVSVIGRRTCDKWTLILAALALAAVVALGSLYWAEFRPDEQTDAQAQAAAIQAAGDGTVAILSYGPDNTAEQLAMAKQHLTGEFLKYYSDFADKMIAPTAKAKGISTSAAVAESAIVEMHPDTAKVLVFVNQATTTAGNPKPAVSASSIVLTLRKQKGKWLISSFDPTPA